MAIDGITDELIEANFQNLEHIRRLDMDPKRRNLIPDAQNALMISALVQIANLSTDPQAKRLAKIATESLNFPRHRG